jgi:hypothetical protein
LPGGGRTEKLDIEWPFSLSPVKHVAGSLKFEEFFGSAGVNNDCFDICEKDSVLTQTNERTSQTMNNRVDVFLMILGFESCGKCR